MVRSRSCAVSNHEAPLRPHPSRRRAKARLLRMRWYLEPRHDIRERRTRAVFARLRGRADMDQADELFVRLQSQPVEDVAIEHEPAGHRARAVTERGRR